MKNPEFKTVRAETYLLCLEVAYVEVGKTYSHLPPHCTLMLWFECDTASRQMVKDLGRIVKAASPIKLTLGEPAVFGPPDVWVSKVVLTPDLQKLHMNLYEYLTKNKSRFQKSQYVGKGYNPHISHKDGFELIEGQVYKCSHVYLAKTNRDHTKPRSIVTKFSLVGS